MQIQEACEEVCFTDGTRPVRWKVPFKIIYLTDQANGPGRIARIDIPGTLATVVKQDGKFPYLVDKQGTWVERKDVWWQGHKDGGEASRT